MKPNPRDLLRDAHEDIRRQRKEIEALRAAARAVVDASVAGDEIDDAAFARSIIELAALVQRPCPPQ